MKPFTIKKISAEENRPPYSYKVDEYFENFVYDHLLKPFNIIIEDEWKVLLSIMIFSKEEDTPEGVSFYEPDMFEEEKLKAFPVGVNIEDIYKSEEHLQNIIGLYFQIISIFFLSGYKVITQEYMVDLMDKLDWDYLLSLPYPAPKEEQGYLDAD